MEQAICVIPARGGSKRIPHKNIRPFHGEPVISYSIRAALDSGVFDEVMVSTDDEEIAYIARKCGASVPFMRSKKNADDHSTTNDALLEVLEQYRSFDRSFRYLVCVYATAPFVTADKLRALLATIRKQKAHEVIPVTAFSFPPQRAFVIGDDGFLSYRYPEYALSRSQDLPVHYHDIGQYYAYDTAAFIEGKGHVSGRRFPLIVERDEAQDIDTEEDWKEAELKYRLLKEAGRL